MVIYKRVALVGETLQDIEVAEVPQGKLSSECWTVQFRGLVACDTCEYVNTKDCGGKRIRKIGKNCLGHVVPVR